MTKMTLEHAKIREQAVSEFVLAIMHGDAEHRAWLIEAAADFIEDKPIAKVRGGPPPLLDAGVPAKRKVEVMIEISDAAKDLAEEASPHGMTQSQLARAIQELINEAAEQTAGNLWRGSNAQHEQADDEPRSG